MYVLPFRLLCLLSIVAVSLGACRSTSGGAEGDEDGWRPLFDGETLEGWHNPYEWGRAWVEDGEIRLMGDKKFFLVTEQPYRDFIFEADVFMPEGEANSGFMFRAHVEPNKVYGYQAEVDTSPRKWFGGLYDEGRRGWLHPVRGDSAAVAAFREQAGEAFRHDAWNTYRIHAADDRIRIYVNDVLTTDYRDDMDREGYIGLQHHGEDGKIYRFRNVRIQELSDADDGQ